MRKIMILTLCICLTVSVTACSRRGDTEEPEMPQSQPIIEKPSSSQVQSEREEGNDPAFVEDDAFYQNILLTYGGEIATKQDGNTQLEMSVASLFTNIGWIDPYELTSSDYYIWYMTMMWKEDTTIEERQEKYKSPLGENSGWFFPQDLFEPLVLKYFDVSVDHLRSDPNVYSEEYKGYSIGGGGGIGESPPIILEKVESDGNQRKLYVRLDYESQDVQNSILTVRLDEDGNYKFESYKNFVAISIVNVSKSIEAFDMKENDTAYGWTLKEVKPYRNPYDAAFNGFLTFTGEVVLTGTITHVNAIYDGFEFVPDEDSMGKILIHDGNSENQFFVSIINADEPSIVENISDLAINERGEYTVVLTQYRLAYVPMMATNNAIIASVERK